MNTTVLVVEDEQDTAELLKRLLEREGFFGHSMQVTDARRPYPDRHDTPTIARRVGHGDPLC